MIVYCQFIVHFNLLNLQTKNLFLENINYHFLQLSTSGCLQSQKMLHWLFFNNKKQNKTTTVSSAVGESKSRKQKRVYCKIKGDDQWWTALSYLSSLIMAIPLPN